MIAVWLRLISPIWQQMGRATSYQMPMTSHCTNCHHHEACTKLKTGFNILIAAIFESNLLASIIASTAAAGEWCAEFWKCQQKCHNVFLFSSHLYLFPSKSAHIWLFGYFSLYGIVATNAISSIFLLLWALCPANQKLLDGTKKKREVSDIRFEKTAIRTGCCCCWDEGQFKSLAKL